MDALFTIQQELKAPKGQYNSFGKYKYRSCEAILEALKPLLGKTKSTLNLSDEIVAVGNRIYVKATATLIDEGGKTYTATAFAREDETKKGMDSAQITGSASSYARKYALNGLFSIDDTTDSDTEETPPAPTVPDRGYTDAQLEQALCEVMCSTSLNSLQTTFTKWTAMCPKMCVNGSMFYNAVSTLGKTLKNLQK